ncbi:MAG: Wadjet anti-phage system protein JetD domain-containing protein [Saccharofermentanales bacterium]
MPTTTEKSILDKLLDKYEKSRTFIGANKVNRSVAIRITELFPNYSDHAEYETFRTVNDAVDMLVRRRIVDAVIDAAKVCSSVRLNLDEISTAYAYIGRTPKKERNSAIEIILDRYKDRNEILRNYCQTQKARIAVNKPVQYYTDDLTELENILKAIEAIFQVQEETFQRDFSVRIFRDSKTFDRISTKVAGLLYEYGDFAEPEHILADLNLVRNPTYVHFKGAGRITLSGQTIDLPSQDIDLALLRDDIGIPSSMLADISRIDITGTTVMTIENLTTFHSTPTGSNRFLIYLGGFHNTVRRAFIKKIYSTNPGVRYLHFGDIDAGGFYILEHLRIQTGIPFEPYQMDIPTLQRYGEYTKPLTSSDRERLHRLLTGPAGGRYRETLEYMLEHGCKLEQEAVK